VSLLLLTDGRAWWQDLSPLLKPAVYGRTFNLRMQRLRRAGCAAALAPLRHQRAPLETFVDAKSPADQLFPLALVEVVRPGNRSARRALFQARPGRGLVQLRSNHFEHFPPLIPAQAGNPVQKQESLGPAFRGDELT